MSRLGAACSALLVLAAALITAPVATAAPDPVAPQAAQLNWAGCSQWVNTERIPTARCAAIALPVDYANPAAGQTQLAVIRIPASGRKIGALFVNPGGPGSSAVDFAAGMASGIAGSPIAEHFDLIGFDPRGVGHSTPEIRCRTDAEFDDYRRDPMADYSPAGVARIEGLYRQYVDKCAQRMGTAFLANVGTVTAARDMESIRAALGEGQLNYLGYSYGTELGTTYLQAYPQQVRAMVLDGAVDPSLDRIEQTIRQMAGFQQAFDDYAADCVQTPGCPLGNDPARAVDNYHALVDPLVAAPGRTSDPRGLSYQDAITGTVGALYTQRYWKFLTSGLLGLQRGTDAGDLLLLADEYQGRRENGRYTNEQDAFTAIRCVDDPVPTDPAAWAAADARIRQVAPFMSYGAFTGFAPRDVCAFWPVPPTTVPRAATAGEPGKVVVVSTTHDPATPYQAGVDLAAQLGAPLITFDGTQHTVVFNGDRCVDTAAVNYLVNLALPPADLRC